MVNIWCGWLVLYHMTVLYSYTEQVFTREWISAATPPLSCHDYCTVVTPVFTPGQHLWGVLSAALGSWCCEWSVSCVIDLVSLSYPPVYQTCNTHTLDDTSYTHIHSHTHIDPCTRVHTHALTGIYFLWKSFFTIMLEVFINLSEVLQLSLFMIYITHVPAS